MCKGLSPSSHLPRHHSGENSASHGATRHAWRTVLNAARSGGSNSVYLTLLGGGVFGNRREWITDAIRRALDRVREQALDVCLVSYGQLPADLEGLVRAYEG